MVGKKAAAKKSTAKKSAPSRRRPLQPGAIRKAVESGDRRAILVSLGLSLAERLEDPETPPREIAPLVSRLLHIAGEIEKLRAEGGDDDVGRAASTADEEFTAS